MNSLRLYIRNNLLQILSETLDIDEGLFNFHPKVEKLKTFIQALKSKYQASLYIYPEKTEDDDIYSIMLGKIKIPASKRGMGYGSKIMNDLIDFSNENNVKIYLTPSDIFGSSVERLKQFYSRFGFAPANDGDKMVYAPNRNQSALNENLKSQIDKTIKRILNHYAINDSDFLGGGTYGSAYKYGLHLVLKITLDRNEAIFANMIYGKKFERISNIYSVQKIKGTDFFVIVLDRLKEITDDDITQALLRISTNDNSYDINGISQEKIQWAQSEYDALINELENAPLRDGYRDVHVGNMGLKNGKLAVYDIQVYDYKRWREKKIRSIKIDENIDSDIKQDEFTYKEESLNYHHGQTDMRINMYKGNKRVAYALYSLYNGKVYFQIIESIVKGYGYGTTLMKHLASIYGYQNLERRSLTPDGVKMRARLDKYFNYDYQEHINKHYKPEIINKIGIKHKLVAEFLTNMINMGYEATWEKWLSSGKLTKDYDWNEISEISFWIKNSKTNNHDIEESPPEYVDDFIKSLIGESGLNENISDQFKHHDAYKLF